MEQIKPKLYNRISLFKHLYKDTTLNEFPHFKNHNDLKNVIVRQKDQFECMLYDNLDNEKPLANKRADIWLLLNVNRLKFTPSLLQELDKRFASQPFANPFEGMSDDDKLRWSVSKNCQTANEWSRQLEYMEDELRANFEHAKVVKSRLDAEKARVVALQEEEDKKKVKAYVSESLQNSK